MTDLCPKELGISRKAMLPVLLEYLDGKEMKEPEEEDDVASVGVMAFFGELHNMIQEQFGYLDHSYKAGFETV